MDISLEGVRQNNLKNITVKIPKNKITVVTGISGSGKSSLVFEAIYSEAQRQLLESMGTFMRINMPKYNQPDVDRIQGLAPAFLVEQKQISNNPRSTVGTFYEVYTYIRLLYSRFGSPQLSAGDFSFNNPAGACPDCKGTGKEIRVDLNRLLNMNLSLNEGAIRHRRYKKNSREWNILSATNLFDMDKKLKDYTKDELNTFLYSEPIVFKNSSAGFVQGFKFEGINKRIMGRATDSRGLPGVNYDNNFTYETKCHVCNNSRLNKRAMEVRYQGRSIVDLVNMEVNELIRFFKEAAEEKRSPESGTLLNQIIMMLRVLEELGLSYLSLSRPIGSLSNGEAQRIKLAKQLGSALTDIVYIFDEPTSGLHVKDVELIIKTIKKLVKKSNTAIVVEHDKEVIRSADHIIEIGPYAGNRGGEIVFQGGYQELISKDTITAQCLKETPLHAVRRVPKRFAKIEANRNNLNHISAHIPMNVICCITGVSGSGKSSLIEEIACKMDNCVFISQAKIGTSSRSNTVTYVDAFLDIRKEFQKHTGQSAGLFAFNSKGACSKCKGLGYLNVNMHFLGDIKTVCDKCNGKRYEEEVLQYKLKGKTIADVLELTVDEGIEFFDNEKVKEKLGLLSVVGLGYLTMGQSFDTLSGGERQRVRLAGGLSKRGSVFLLDEPSKGLHSYDVRNLMKVLNEIVERPNSVIMVEHNMDIIRQADYIIDMGPGAGKMGGKIVASGTPEEIAGDSSSITGRYI